MVVRLLIDIQELKRKNIMLTFFSCSKKQIAAGVMVSLNMVDNTRESLTCEIPVEYEQEKF